jgi:hypothetical protein
MVLQFKRRANTVWRVQGRLLLVCQSPKAAQLFKYIPHQSQVTKFSVSLDDTIAL